MTVSLHGAERLDGGDGPVAYRDGRIVTPAAEADADARTVDVSGLRLAPGFVDLQVNGAAGADLTSDPGAVWDVAATVAAWGVTAFLPTLVSPCTEVIDRLAAVLADGPPAGWRGAVPLGIHAEGPYLASGRRGTHPTAALRSPVPSDADAWDPAVRLVTLAPELPGAIAAVWALTAAGVVVSLGHTDAAAAEVRAAVDAGARAVTHCWNAMRPLHHREPGPVGVALGDERLTVGLIADGVHVADDVLELTFRSAAGRVALVTDATAASGGPDGTTSLAGVPVTVRAGEVRNADGALAGSATTMDACVRHVVALGIPPAEAVAAASRIPARLLGDGTRGSLAPGARADLVLLDDALAVRAVVIGGRVRVDRDGRFAAVPA